MLALLKHDLNKQGIIPEGIWQWPVKSLAVLIHGYLYLTVVGHRKLRRSEETQVNVSVLLEKPDITYPSRNS